MPCGCEDKEKNTILLRFIGGPRKPNRLRGPFRSFDTGKIYEMDERWAVLPYWERVDEKHVEIESVEKEPKIELTPEYSDKEVPEPPSEGLTEAFRGRAPKPEDFIRKMDIEGLKALIAGQGGKVDGRWGINRLREEARKLQ